jgi:hypothetical protein
MALAQTRVSEISSRLPSFLFVVAQQLNDSNAQAARFAVSEVRLV